MLKNFIFKIHVNMIMDNSREYKKMLIRNAIIYDETGNLPFKGDLLINGSKIEKINYHLDITDVDSLIVLLFLTRRKNKNKSFLIRR